MVLVKCVIKMDYNKIIISLVIIFVIVAVGGFLFFNSSNNKTVNDVVPAENNTSSSINAEKINTEQVSSSSSAPQQSSSGESKYVSKEYAQQHMDEWNSGKGYYWVGDTQYDSATGKIIGGGSDEDQKALREIVGDKV